LRAYHVVVEQAGLGGSIETRAFPPHPETIRKVATAIAAVDIGFIVLR
jgi:hypothetical protein